MIERIRPPTALSSRCLLRGKAVPKIRRFGGPLSSLSLFGACVHEVKATAALASCEADVFARFAFALVPWPKLWTPAFVTESFKPMNLMFAISLLAEAETPAQQPAPGLGQMVFPLVMIVFVWYFLILRPQGKERRDREAQLANLKKNDRVVTFAGIIGTVVGFSNDNKEVTLRVDDNVKMKFLRSAIQGPLVETTEDPAKLTA